MKHLEFYSHDELGVRRMRSPELDFGVQWRDAHSWPQYRVSWVEATGEVVAVKLLGSDQNAYEYAILGTTTPGDREEIERVLKGWADACGGLHSLDWVIGRVS